MDAKITELIVTALITWVGSYIGLSVTNRRAAAKRRNESESAKVEADRQETERRKHDDDLRLALTNDVIRRSNELAMQVENINTNWLAERAEMQRKMYDQDQRYQAKEASWERILKDATTELTQQLTVAAEERKEYRHRIDTHAMETHLVRDENIRILAIAEGVQRENSELRNGLRELEIKVAGYGDLQKQLTEALRENNDLKARVTHLEKQVVERDTEIALLKADMEALKPKSETPPMIEHNPALFLTVPDSAIVTKPEGGNPL